MGIVIAPLPEQCGTNAKAERASSEDVYKRQTDCYRLDWDGQGRPTGLVLVESAL